jgi:hypothetical protein
MNFIPNISNPPPGIVILSEDMSNDSALFGTSRSMLLRTPQVFSLYYYAEYPLIVGLDPLCLIGVVFA